MTAFHIRALLVLVIALPSVLVFAPFASAGQVEIKLQNPEACANQEYRPRVHFDTYGQDDICCPKGVSASGAKICEFELLSNITSAEFDSGELIPNYIAHEGDIVPGVAFPASLFPTANIGKTNLLKVAVHCGRVGPKFGNSYNSFRRRIIQRTLNVKITSC